MKRYLRHNDYYDTEEGYIPEELYIWIPPKYNIDGFGPLNQVVLQGEGKGSALIFFVPKEWNKSNSKSGWKTRLKDIGWTLKEDSKGLLSYFINLSGATPDRFLDFALRWGPMWRSVKHYEGSIPETFNTTPWIESVEEWRFKAKEIKILLEISSFIMNAEAAPQELLKILLPRKHENFMTVEKQKEWIMHYINIEMLDHRVKFYINWTGEAPELKIGSTLGFLSAVWFQLLQTITSQAICLCDGCGQVYAREGRKPAKGKKNYCNYCGIAAAKRDYARKRRQLKQ
jgi:hypothetical protein